jgi:hypothetical protein
VSESGQAGVPAEGQSGVEGELSPQATTTTGTTSTGGSLSFGITFKGTPYLVSVYAPDPNGQYGFTVTYTDSTTTPASTITVASLIYKDENDWQIIASLPKALQVDTNLTVNQLSIDLVEGAVSPLPAPTS